MASVTADSHRVALAPDPTNGRLRALRDSLVQLPNDLRAPTWLWEVGTLMSQHLAVIMDSDSTAGFPRQHPREFAFSEPDAAYFYTGYHFRELVTRFPQHHLADDAAYRLTALPEGGECEGYLPCYIEYRLALTALTAFLTQFPESEYAPEAIHRAGNAFTESLAEVLDNPRDPEMLDLATVDSLLNAYSATVTRLPEHLRSRARPAIDSARAMLESLTGTRP
jgi:hypothetical protein